MSVKKDMDSGKLDLRPTIFKDLLTADPDSGYIPPAPENLKDEAYSILAAAADTTGNAMTVAAYQVVSNSAMYKKLSAELKAAFPDPHSKMDFMTLEKLPYLVSDPFHPTFCRPQFSR
jgi:cytochrome P450